MSRQNLVRVNDILRELEKQWEPLKKQSETAREYLKKKESLKTFDINMFLLESERLKEQIRDMENKIQTAKGELEKDTADYDRYEDTNMRLLRKRWNRSMSPLKVISPRRMRQAF